VHEVERARLELAGEEIVLDEADVPEAFLRHEAVGRAEHGLVDIRSRHLSVRADPLAQDPQPAEDAAAEIEGAGAVRAAVLRQLLFGLLVAVSLAVTPILAAYSNSNLSSHDQRTIAVVASISSLLVGITAAFGLRRSI
jgi:hypothetical protein